MKTISIHPALLKGSKTNTKCIDSFNRSNKSSDKIVVPVSKLKKVFRKYFIFYVVSMIIVVLFTGFCSYNLGKSQVSIISYKSTSTYFVKEGDSLWSIATEISDGETDIKRIVHEIMVMNNMDSATISPSDELLLPVFQ